jgi:two-component system nitrogen regulation sensor histidine kinase NtrY
MSPIFMEPAARQSGVSIQVIASEHSVLNDLDAGQMEHVLVNVFKNAIEACEAGQRIQAEVRNGKVIIRNNGKPIDTETGDAAF